MKINEDVANMFMNVVMFSASIVHFILEKLEDLYYWWIRLDWNNIAEKTFLTVVASILGCMIAFIIYCIAYADVICANKLQAMNASGFFDDKTRICYVEYEEGKFIDLDKFSVVVKR